MIVQNYNSVIVFFTERTDKESTIFHIYMETSRLGIKNNYN